MPQSDATIRHLEQGIEGTTWPENAAVGQGDRDRLTGRSGLAGLHAEASPLQHRRKMP